MKMTRTWMGLALLFGGLGYSSLCAAAEPQPVETFVFVGERIALEEAPDPCDEEFQETGELTCINMDALYTARYRVLDRIVGSYPSDVIEFSVSDHYGFPRFARFRHALLFVALADDDAWLHKYQAIPVHRTVGRQWAACGDIRRDPEGAPSPQLRPLRFEREIALESDLSDAMLAGYRAGQQPHWRIENGKVWCSQGMLLEDVYEVVRNGVMRAREVTLPAWPEPLTPEPCSRSE
ncbi:hypothetical protein QFW77_18430 [Luteimonas sp. RD2P54]|uniref:Secreted protein n=1 Tax=Luteimonas endophytica TaxID=3042023 RepID=A0ABT6JEB4_9GAMM|nr:hypothetical protein [Luteimonas endophytica]MDH5824947.1 hypothetical protein [Luteimonas endophytica]